MNIVVIIADALRRDSVFGDDPAMPRLHERLQSWDTLSRYFSAAPWTLPACTSLLTGRDASVHGHFSHLHTLGHPTLVGCFGDDRVKAAYVNNRALDASSGLFGDFDEHELIVDDHAETFARTHRFLDERDADGRAYFLLVHSNLVHDYYLARTRSQYESYFPDDGYALETSHVIRWNGLDAAQREGVRRTYRACAAALDGELERLLERLDDDTLILFLADHGEGLDPEIGRVHHGGRMQQDLLLVPCSIRLPGSASAATVAAIRDAGTKPVTTVDLLPTLLGIAGLTAPAGIDGVDLSRAVDNGRRLRASDDRYVYIRGRYRLNSNSRGKNMLGTVRKVNNVLRATVAHRFRISAEIDYPYKLVVTDFEARNAAYAWLGRQTLRAIHIGKPVAVTRDRQWRGLECFDLESDPEERRNLLGDSACPDRALALAAPYRDFADSADFATTA